MALNGMLTGVEVSTKPTFRAEAPKAIFRPPIVGSTGFISPGSSWDVTPDGQRFLIETPAETDDNSAGAINVVLNWTGLLKK